MAQRAVTVVAAWAASLGLAGMPAADAAQTIRRAVAERVAYRTESGDRFDEAPVILARGSDDCDGHAIIGAALGAASGHPTRIVGLSLDGIQPEHVRAEVGDGVRWYSADSTGPDRQAVLHSPIADVSPRPINGLWNDIGDALDELVEDIRSIGPNFNTWINSGSVLADIWKMVKNPKFWVTAAAIWGCPAVTAGIGATACGYLGANALTWKMFAAETYHGIGPGRWAEISEQQRQERLREAEEALGVEEMAARMYAAERVAMSREPEIALRRDPQIAHETIDYINRNGRAETRQVLFHRMYWRPGAVSDEQAAQIVIRMLDPLTPGLGSMDVQQDAQRAFEWAVQQSEDRLLAAIEEEAERRYMMDNCREIPGDIVQDLLRAYGPQYRRFWCLGTDEDRRRFINRARGECPPIPADVAHIIVDRAAWCENHQQGRNRMVNEARAAMGVIGADSSVPATVREYLGVRDDGWATADLETRREWEIEAAAMALEDLDISGLNRAPGYMLTPGQLEALQRIKPPATVPSVGSGGGGAQTALLAALVGGLLWARG